MCNLFVHHRADLVFDKAIMKLKFRAVRSALTLS
jgi:hypothetical protein